MDDVEMQPPYGDAAILDKKTKAAGDCRVSCIAVTLSIVVTACIFCPVVYFMDDTHYYVAIESASGLTPKTEGVSFNLTLGVASRSYGSKACIEPGALRMEVYYHGVQLAASEAEVGRLCAGPGKSAEQRVAARATAVPMGRVLDSLTVDMKQQGAALFDVSLYLPRGSYGVGDRVLGCEGSPVGAAAVWCHVY